ncbi:hypothetical protein JQS43_08535 [Natronosporangium hydrolyticum]|uniref:Uncharacterized protein n=1 Tax=Natronosporangium hydrolyticum TaxID=2811111 RepID=A0A895YQC0_9ACTN|nr:hypothetical protein [Natronosporangium hydrolyticum]QSB16320.1 hypothetical protein JQS43_08535 [Natronosporangium hydrolyticum]
MSWLRQSLVCAVAAALVLAVSGCQLSQPAESAGEAELFHLRGEVRPDEQWPARGSLTGDQDLVDEVTEVADAWQTPDGVPRHPSPVFSSIVWLGEVAGQVLGVVAFAPADEYSDTWIVEITGEPGDLEVTEARNFRAGVTNFIEDTEVLPIRSAGVGPRYLVSAFVDEVYVDGVTVAVDDGLTEPVRVPECELVEVVLDIRQGRLIAYGDWGAAVPYPVYPLFFARGAEPPEVSDVAKIQGMDTCIEAKPGGWLAAAREVLAPETPAVIGWGELARIDSGPLAGAVDDIGILGSGNRDQAVVVMWRPESGGAPAFSSAHLEPSPISNPMVFSLSTPEGPLGVVTYVRGSITPEREFSDIGVPNEAGLLVAEPGVIVVALPDHEIEISYTRNGEREQVRVEAP